MITPSFGLTATERVLPNLALDFITASLDSRITFTRTTDATHPATYVNSSGVVTAATNDQPRFDYDPVTLACKGLLIEESRTNLFLYSEQFDNVYWTKSSASIVADATTAPSNSAVADRLVPNTVAAAHYVRKTVTGTAASYILSVYAKPSGYNYLRLLMSDGTSTVGDAYFNVSTGAIGSNAAGTASISAAGNGWYRCTMTATLAVSASCNMDIRCHSANNQGSWIANGTDGLYIWGAQLEAGAFATSYIPTTTTALTRNADVATMTGTNFSDWFNASEGTVVATFTPQAAISTASTAQLLFEIGLGAIGDRFRAFRNNDDGKMYISNNAGGSANVSALGGVVAATGSVVSVSSAYKLDNFGIATNGNSAAVDTSATVCSADQLRIGRGYNNANYLNGTMSKLLYYPQRLTNAELQAFSKG